MKKFSILITESKTEVFKKHPLINKDDWDLIFKPLIEHIYSNLKSEVAPPDVGIFNTRTKGILDQLIDSISTDYGEYYLDVINDGSEESFFDAFDIKVNPKDIIDCIQPLLDKTDKTKYFEDNKSWRGGYYHISIINLKYKKMEDFIEDIEDIHLKLKMFNICYKILINTTIRHRSIILNKDATSISTDIDSLGTSFNCSSEELFKLIKDVSIFIYNKETVQVPI